MGATPIGSMYPATLESIEANRGEDKFRCGCSLTKDGWSIWLCQYHNGYEDGIERALRNEEQP